MGDVKQMATINSSNSHELLETIIALKQQIGVKESEIHNLLKHQQKTQNQLDFKTKELNNSKRRSIDIALKNLNCIWETDKNGIYTYVNEKTARVLGYDINEILGKNPFFFMSKKEAIRVKKLFLGSTIKNGTSHEFEHWSIKKDGSSICLLTTVIPVFDQNHVITGYRGEFIDITSRKKSEIKLQKEKEKAILACKAKSEFLYNMSHELRSPLNSLLLLAKTLENNYKNNLYKDQLKSINIIKSSGMELLSLINDLLDLARIEAGKMPVNIRNISIEEIKTSIINSFDQMIREKSLELIFDIDESINYTIKSDFQRIMQILKNLISNAVKFTNEGSITIRIKPASLDVDLSLSGLSHSRALEFSVSDTGIGIPKDKQKAIFEDFQQAELDTCAKYGGTGLGLSISEKLSFLLGGEMKLTSTVNMGSTFSFYIDTLLSEADYHISNNTSSINNKQPQPQTNNETLTTPTQNQHHRVSPNHIKIFNHEKVLLIDSDVVNLYALSNTIKSLGLDILQADKAHNALSLLEKHPDIKLIITDINLSDMTAYSLINTIRSSKNHIPIITCTADVIKEIREKSIDCGANEYLTKPIDTNLLFHAISKFIDHKI